MAVILIQLELHCVAVPALPCLWLSLAHVSLVS
jgi:hypothetical protein